jgi:5-methylcytosine-specific restriction endonuclease McrBC regulatory subunit McrC
MAKPKKLVTAVRIPRPKQRSRGLLRAVDHGRPVVVSPELFAPPQRGGGWGNFIEPFIRLNERALRALDVQPEIRTGESGATLALLPGARAGAVPLRSAQTGHVVSGFLVEPRFGWRGMGGVLAETGWHAAPEILDGHPLVPGSGREVPPWVIAGPVLARFAELLRNLTRGYRVVEEVRQRPRGTIDWQSYLARQVTRGRLVDLPCRFPDLSDDAHLRRMIRWALERVRRELAVIGTDAIAALLITLADQLLANLKDVVPLPPTRASLDRMRGRSTMLEAVTRRGLEALAWIVDERGLAGGQESDGLAWVAPLDVLWENYVEGIVRREASLVGGTVHVGRDRGTVVMFGWDDPSLRSLGHLLPDIVVRERERVRIVDAKYKAHFAELDERGWRDLTDDVRSSHRADIHQVLAYSSVFDAPTIEAELVYPLRIDTWTALHGVGRDVAQADIRSGQRNVRLRLRGVPFGQRWQRAPRASAHPGQA